MTKQPPAVPLPGPNVTPEPNEKIKGLAGNCSRHTNQATRHPSNQENTLARRDETASCRPSANATPERNEKIKVLAGIPLLGHRAPLFQAQKSVHRAPKTLRAGMLVGNSTRHPSNQENTLARRDETAVPLPGPNVTPEPNEKSRVWQAIVPGTQNKPQDTLQIRKTPWHGVTKQPPAVPLPGPNVTPEPNEKIKGLAGNCSRHNENIVARRDCRPSGRPNVTREPMKTSRFWQANPLFQAQKASQKTPFESGKHPGTA